MGGKYKLTKKTIAVVIVLEIQARLLSTGVQTNISQSRFHTQMNSSWASCSQVMRKWHISAKINFYVIYIVFFVWKMQNGSVYTNILLLSCRFVITMQYREPLSCCCEDIERRACSPFSYTRECARQITIEQRCLRIPVVRIVKGSAALSPLRCGSS